MPARLPPFAGRLENRVTASQRDLARPGLAALYRALDLGRLVQRSAGLHGDHELAAAGLVDVVGGLGQRDRMEVGGRAGGGQVPRGLGAYAAAGGQRGGEQCESQFHGISAGTEIDGCR